MDDDRRTVMYDSSPTDLIMVRVDATSVGQRHLRGNAVLALHEQLVMEEEE